MSTTTKDAGTNEAGGKRAPHVTRRQQLYRDEVVGKLKKEFGYPNPMMVPRLQKIVVNMGVGRAVENKNRIEAANKDLTAITGQKPVIRKARGAVSGFKLREGYPIGVAVTLRRFLIWNHGEHRVHGGEAGTAFHLSPV